jgi:hypothetical protein
MRVLLFMILSFMSLIHTAPKKNQMPIPTPTPSQSSELNSLNSEKISLENRRKELERWQDFWHSGVCVKYIIAVTALFNFPPGRVCWV